MEPKPFKARLTLVETLCYEQDGEEPVQLPDPSFCCLLNTDEQPYIRKLKVGQEWTPLSKGCWVTDACLLVIKNEAQQFMQVIPTPEQVKIGDRRVVEVSFMADQYGNRAAHALIYPGQSLPGLRPADLRFIELRCREGVASLTVMLFPS